MIVEPVASSPGRKIETQFEFTRQVDCDRGRLAQLFSILLAHGAANRPVRVVAAPPPPLAWENEFCPVARA